MPRATVSTDTVRKELRSAPPDGYVVLRQLSYAEMMQRRDMIARVYSDLPTDQRRAVKQETVRQYMELVNRAASEWEFARCIVDHNLEDDQGNKLDFTNPMALDVLNPKIGAEIDRYIEELNQEDEEAPLSEKSPSSSSLDEENEHTSSTIP
jgi:hypothetical protein